MSAALALQKALRTRLATYPAVTALLPAENIFDRHGRPERFPCVMLGEDQEIVEDLTLERHHVTVYATLHVWDREPGLTNVKAISGAIRSAVSERLDVSPFACVDQLFQSARYMRDRDVETSHAVIVIRALVGEVP